MLGGCTALSIVLCTNCWTVTFGCVSGSLAKAWSAACTFSTHVHLCLSANYDLIAVSLYSSAYSERGSCLRLDHSAHDVGVLISHAAGESKTQTTQLQPHVTCFTQPSGLHTYITTSASCSMENATKEVCTSAWSCHVLFTKNLPAAQSLETKLPEAGVQEREWFFSTYLMSNVAGFCPKSTSLLCWVDTCKYKSKPTETLPCLSAPTDFPRYRLLTDRQTITVMLP